MSSTHKDESSSVIFPPIRVAHIVACSKNRAIGKDNKIPWHLSEDLKRFKFLTQHNSVIMGRKTYESIGKPLPKRQNIVISKTMTKPEGVELQIVSDIASAVAACDPKKITFIIGGASIYEQTLDIIDTIFLTEVDQEVDGDTFYPQIPDHFREVHREKHDGFSFVNYRSFKTL